MSLQDIIFKCHFDRNNLAFVLRGVNFRFNYEQTKIAAAVKSNYPW